MLGTPAAVHTYFEGFVYVEKKNSFQSCLLVGLCAGLHKKYWRDFKKIWCGTWVKYEPIQFGIEVHPCIFSTFFNIARRKGEFSLFLASNGSWWENSAIYSRWIFTRLLNLLRIKDVLTLIWFLCFINLLFFHNKDYDFISVVLLAQL